MLCQVESYSGSRLHERPRRFTWKESWLEIDQILEQWLTPESLGFKVRVGDNIFRLEHKQDREVWEVEIISTNKAF
jgi:hypothetical protein